MHFKAIFKIHKAHSLRHVSAALLITLACAAMAKTPPAATAAAGGDDALPPLLLLTSTDTPPYSYRDEETGEIIGLEIEIAREAAAKLGRRLEVKADEFPSLLPKVSEGVADMAASGLTITEGRRQAVDFSIPYATEGGMFLYRSSEPMPSMVRAEKLRVAVMDASTYDFYLSAHGIDPIRFGSYKDAVQCLKRHVVDTVFSDSCSIKFSAERSNGEFAVSRLETREDFGIALRKGNKQLKDALDEVITERKKAK